VAGMAAGQGSWAKGHRWTHVWGSRQEAGAAARMRALLLMQATAGGLTCCRRCAVEHEENVIKAAGQLCSRGGQAGRGAASQQVPYTGFCTQASTHQSIQMMRLLHLLCLLGLCPALLNSPPSSHLRCIPS
jgi:hypothetical protein